MQNCWPECKCDLCLIMQSHLERGQPLVVEKQFDPFADAVTVEEPVPPLQDEDKIDYTEYEYHDVDVYPVIPIF